MLTVFGDELPLQGWLLPTQATLTEDQFLVGTRALAERQPDGRWIFDDDGVAVAREIYGEDATEGPKESPLDRWDRLKSREPRPGADAVGTDLVRVYVQMENDPNMFTAGRDLTAAHPNRIVWVQSNLDGTFRVVRGQSLLDASSADTRFKLLVCGHGRTSAQTRERLLSGRTATGLAKELSRLMPQLGIRSVQSISLLSCALETPVEQRSFGREFVPGVVALGEAGMETTVYADSVITSLRSNHFRKYTQLHDNAPVRLGAAGKTWIFRVDPDGSVSVRDKFPNGDDGVDVPVACCSILKLREHPETTGRSLALTDAGAAAWSRLRGRFREVVSQHRPAGMHLVPSLTLKDDGPAVLTYLRLDSGEALTREVVAPADIAVLRTGFGAITSGLADIRDQGLDVSANHNRLDLLNLGMLALMLSDLAADGSGGDAFQEALWYLGVTQGGFQLGADAAAMASVIAQVAGRSEAASLGVLVNSTENLSHALAAVSRLAQAGTIATDVARLIDSLGVGNRARVTQAAVQVGLDAAGLALVGVAAAADLAGLALIAAVAEGLAVPLQGLIVGIAALNAAVSNEIERLDRNLGPLSLIDKGYAEPLVRDSLHPEHPDHRALLVHGFAPLRRIDFVNGTVTFADATVGASALHRNQLYWQGGSHRLHDWWISDNADHQGSYARHGQELDLWTLLRSGDRPTSPQVPLSRSLRDPNLVLGLVTPPNIAIHFDQYSSSRAGGDLSLLGNP
ncbi:C80 family cysteine peptidase [Roseateles chitinivorans]|uniref:C80 family cysteine peptidase n=2 Tax=Roseateles TaxID=93681 RepID=UPI003D669848